MPLQTNANSRIAIQVWDKMVGTVVNDEIDILKYFDEGKEPFSGLQVNIVDDTDYGQRAAEMAEGGAFPVADRTTREQRVVTTQEMGIAGGLTFKTINATRRGAPGALTQAVKTEVANRWKAFKFTLALRTTTGGPTQGILNEAKAGSAGTGQATLAASVVGNATVGSDLWEYSGFSRHNMNDGRARGLFGACLPANNATWVRVRVVNNSRQQATTGYAEIALTAAGGASNPAAFVAAFDDVTGNVTIAVVHDGAGTASLSTLALAPGFAASLEVHDTQYVLAAGADAGDNFGTIATIPGSPTAAVYATNTMRGILSELCTVAQAGLVRTTGAAGDSFQAHIHTQVITTPQGRAPPTAARIEQCLAQVEDTSGKEPGKLLMNRLSAHSFVGAVVNANTYRWDAQEKTKTYDIGSKIDGLNIMGYTLERSQWVPRGLAIFCNTKVWNRYVLKEPSMLLAANATTDQLAKFVHNRTSSNEFFIYTDQQLFCRYPHCELIFTGFTY